MSNRGFDAQGFFAALDAVRESRGKTWKQVASEARISASTLTRLGQGKRPDVDSLAALATWSRLQVDRFIPAKSATKISREPLAEMTALLRTDRNLTPQGVEALEAILKSAYTHLKKRKDEA